jgi:RimJ/RimL family protein N-acetyltransferase
MLRLLNEPSFLANIGDRGVRTLDDARRYLAERLIASYETHGYGLWIVEPRAPSRAESGAEAGARQILGICGLVRRDTLPGPDLGFAFLPEFWSQGFARESAAAVRDHAFAALGLTRLLAIVNPANAPSIRLLESLGFRRAPADETEPGATLLFTLEPAAP